MEKERKEDLSIYYWLQDLFSDASFVNIVDDYPDQELVLPTIASVSWEIEALNAELGNRKMLKYRTYTFDIYAENKSQRDEYAYRIFNALENPISVYDYDEGFPPDYSPSQIDCFSVIEKRLQVIRIDPELVEKMYYRATVLFVAQLNNL